MRALTAVLERMGHVRTPDVNCYQRDLEALNTQYGPLEMRPDLGMLLFLPAEQVVLEGRRLGSFRLGLELNRPIDDEGNANFRVWRPADMAAGRFPLLEHYLHPHVSSGGALCMGNSSIMAAAALLDGRVGDAFLLARSVLHNYHPSSCFALL